MQLPLLKQTKNVKINYRGLTCGLFACFLFEAQSIILWGVAILRCLILANRFIRCHFEEQCFERDFMSDFFKHRKLCSVHLKSTQLNWKMCIKQKMWRLEKRFSTPCVGLNTVIVLCVSFECVCSREKINCNGCEILAFSDHQAGREMVHDRHRTHDLMRDFFCILPPTKHPLSSGRLSAFIWLVVNIKMMSQ